MPVELSDLLGDERWVAVQVGNATFNVAYRPSATSLRRQAELQKRQRVLANSSTLDEVEQANEIGAIFCEMISAWDLVDGGVPLPLTPEVVTRTLPGAVFEAIMAAVGADGKAAQEEKKVLSATSGAGLPPRDKLASAPNGMHPSAPQSSWASRPGS